MTGHAMLGAGFPLGGGKGRNLLHLHNRGIEWSFKNNGSRQILGGSRNLGVSNWSLGISSSKK